jgi:hypothetical protein
MLGLFLNLEDGGEMSSKKLFDFQGTAWHFITTAVRTSNPTQFSRKKKNV